MSYKIMVRTTESGPYATNACRYATRKEAKDAGFELSMRWFAVRDWKVLKSTDPVNYAFKDNQNVRLEESL